MAAVELDPVFVRALKLLHSKSKDSTAQLKAMLDDAIAQRKGLKPPGSVLVGDKLLLSKSKTDEEKKKKDAEKRSFDRSSKDPSEPDIKKSKSDSSSKSKYKDEKESRDRDKERERSRKDKEKRESDEREAQRQKEKAEKEKKEKEVVISRQESEITLISDEEGGASQMDAGDFALEMGIACVVCRQFDVSSGNQLIECQECHSLYHQECHKPPVTEEDVSDPRFVWYCSRCTRSLKKMVTQKQPAKSVKPTSVPVASTSVKDLSSPGLSKPSSKPDLSAASQAFRRIDPKTIVTPKDPPISSSGSKPMAGLAGLAANLAKPRSEAKSSSSTKKSDHHKDGSSRSSKSEGGKSSSSSKSDGSSSKSREEKGSHSSKSSKDDKERKGGDSSSSSSHKSSKSHEEKHDDSPTSSSAKSSSSSSKEDRSRKSPSHSEGQGSSSSSASGSPPDKGSGSSNKQAVANLSMVTANKRIQMMKKKAQTKPQEKKVHIK